MEENLLYLYSSKFHARVKYQVLSGHLTKYCMKIRTHVVYFRRFYFLKVTEISQTYPIASLCLQQVVLDSRKGLDCKLFVRFQLLS